MTQVERYKHKGYTIVIDYDDDPQTPLDCDDVGVMVCLHPRYLLGHNTTAGRSTCIDTATEVAEALRRHDRRLSNAVLTRWLRIFYGATVVKPLYLLDHSGITISTGTYSADPGGWDTSHVGFVFDTAQTREDTGCTDVEAAIEAEVRLYASYLEGDAVGYTVLDARGEVIDSCWGFLGDGNLAEAKAAAEASVPDTEDTSMTDSAALDALAALWSANEWNADLMDPTFRILTSTGRKVDDPNEDTDG